MDQNMKEAVFDALDFSIDRWLSYEDEKAAEDFLAEITRHGYKIVKETEQ